MAQTTRLLVEQGAWAANWFIHTPVCCPSRGQFMTGRYFHNIRMPSAEAGGCMHVNESLVNPATFASRLNAAGYRVGLFGKYLNTWNVHQKTWPRGFERWFANGGGSDVEPGGYVNASFQDQDTVYIGHPGEYAGYTTAIIGNKSLEWLQHVAPSGQPFAMIVTPKAPHIAATPAPWYRTRFSDRQAPRTPAYNFSALDHHWVVAQQGPITDTESAEIDELFRDRWRTLLSVDDLVAALVAGLEQAGVLHNTYILYTSDHGYQLGQLRLPMCKLHVYDFDLRIPFAIRGPGIAPNTTFTSIASNVDVAPTILDLAGLPHSDLDGVSMAPALLGLTAAAERDCHYVEYLSLGEVVRMDHLVDAHNNTYRALRCLSPSLGNILYAEFTDLPDWNFTRPDFFEFYDLDSDPHQLHNIYRSVAPALIQTLHQRLVDMFACIGPGCHPASGQESRKGQ